MNDDFTSLENELRGLEPLAPSQRLDDAIGAAFGEPLISRESKTWWQRLGFNRPVAALCWGTISPAVTAVMVVAALRFAASAQLPSPPANHSATGTGVATTGPRGGVVYPGVRSGTETPTRSVNVLYQASDEGVVLDGANEPVRRLRYRSTDLVEWHNPRTGAAWEVSYPREDVVLVPIEAD